MVSRRELSAPTDPRVVDSWGRGRGGRPWRRKREEIFLRDNYECCGHGCDYVGIDLELDHIVNVAAGGTDDDDNLQSLCVPCHKEKTAAESRGQVWMGRGVSKVAG